MASSRRMVKNFRATAQPSEEHAVRLQVSVYCVCVCNKRSSLVSIDAASPPAIKSDCTN